MIYSFVCQTPLSRLFDTREALILRFPPTRPMGYRPSSCPWIHGGAAHSGIYLRYILEGPGGLTLVRPTALFIGQTRSDYFEEGTRDSMDQESQIPYCM